MQIGRGLSDLSLLVARDQVKNSFIKGKANVNSELLLSSNFTKLLSGNVGLLTSFKQMLESKKVSSEWIGTYLTPVGQDSGWADCSGWVITTNPGMNSIPIATAVSSNWWDQNIPSLKGAGSPKVTVAAATKTVALAKDLVNPMGSSSGISTISERERAMVNQAIETLTSAGLKFYAAADGNTNPRRRGSGFGASAIFTGPSGVMYANQASISSSLSNLRNIEDKSFFGKMPLPTGLGLFGAQIGPESRGALNLARVEIKLLVRLLRQMPEAAAKLKAVTSPEWILDNAASFGLAQVIPFNQGIPARQELSKLVGSEIKSMGQIFADPALSSLYSLAIFKKKIERHNADSFFAFYAGDLKLASALQEAKTLGELLMMQRQSHYYRSWARKLDGFISI